MQKKCYKCKEYLNTDLFGKNKRTKDGFEPVCKQCYKARRPYKYNGKRQSSLGGKNKKIEYLFTSLDGEEWRPIGDFPYEVSNKGRVRSLFREFVNSLGRNVWFNAKMLSPVPNEEGYMKVSLSSVGEDGKRKQKLYSVHRLVGFAFLENPMGYDQINHIDGNKGNNILSNLEWCTLSQNRQHAYRTGLQKGAHGTKAANSKLTNDIILEIRAIGKNMKQCEIAKIYGISFQHVSDILNRKTWTHI